MAIILDNISSLATLAAFTLAIVLPFFAYRQYKNFALRKIRAEYNEVAQPQLTVKGGTRGGLVGLVATVYGVIIFAIIFSIMSWFLNGMYEKAEDYAKDNGNGGYYQEMPFDDDLFGFDNNSNGIW